MKRRSSTEREATKLADAFTAAEGELREREERVRSIETEVAEEIAEAAAALGLGELTAAEYEKRKRDSERRAEEARAARATSAEVVEALRPLATAAAEASERERIEAAEADVGRLATAIGETETTLVKLRGEHSLATERVEVCRRQALDAAAAFAPEVAIEADARAAQDEELARWYARNPHEDDRIPVHLRQRVPEIRTEEAARRDEERERLREHPDRVDPHDVFGDGLRPGQPFPRLGDAL